VSISEAPRRVQHRWAPSALLAVFFLNLLVRGDGYYPFSQSVDPHLFSFVVLLQTLILIVCSVWTASLLIGTGSPVGWIGMSDRTQLVLVGSSVALIGVLQLLNARRFAEFGYAGRPVLLVALLLGASLTLALLWRKNRFYGILLADLILKAYPLVCFPITAKRSDMLPVIREAARSMLAGENIYRNYLLDNGVWTQMVRFPGLVISYAPATLFHVDPRLVTLAGHRRSGGREAGKRGSGGGGVRVGVPPPEASVAAGWLPRTGAAGPAADQHGCLDLPVPAGRGVAMDRPDAQ
jgi:hypothetical protein